MRIVLPSAASAFHHCGHAAGRSAFDPLRTFLIVEVSPLTHTSAMLLAALTLATLTAPDEVAPEDRSGPSRQARCKIDDGPARRCRFTPLFGDGSFNIEVGRDQEWRIVVDGHLGHLFEVAGPTKRAPVWGNYRRDAVKHACWLRTGSGDGPRSICVYAN